jgi:two-component system, LytTR family, response regulator AlgR
MMRLIIVDDELPARNRLRRLLQAQDRCEVVGEAGNSRQALELIERHRPHALLLDISMPGLDGLGLARVLRRQDPAPAVIFCTAWPDRALDAFNCDAVDYLLKPVRSDRLAAALEKARRASGAADEEQDARFLCSTVGGRRELIGIETIACLLAEDKYTTVFHDGGKAVVNESLVDLEQEYPRLFQRVHRNALVAMVRVRGLERVDGSYRVILGNCEFRPLVSRRQLPEIRKLIRRMT